MNFLEQLAAEWYEFNGYFVRRNILVGRRRSGGYECELDVVAFNPKKKHLIQLEASSDTQSWDIRERRFRRKFEAGQKAIPDLFETFKPLPEIEQIALFVSGSTKTHSQVGGGRVLPIKEFMENIRDGIKDRSVLSSAIPEQYVILRTLQFALAYWPAVQKK